MKVFLWRVARWCLSTRGKLIRKTMECPIYCSFCVECDENDWHIFVGCEQVAKVWQEASLKHQVDDTREFIFTALQQFSYPKIEVFVFAMWTQWKHHNQILLVRVGSFSSVRASFCGIGVLLLLVRALLLILIRAFEFSFEIVV
ncbi:hypothetical protein JHK82_055872 [Glycine max]|nr:hypothetical protein JHK82_055872 [Glycine max]